MTTIDWTRPIETVDGRKARDLGERKVICGNLTRFVAVECEDHDGVENAYLCSLEGDVYYSGRRASFRIRNVPAPRRKVWVAHHVMKGMFPWTYNTEQQIRDSVPNAADYTFHEIEIDG